MADLAQVRSGFVGLMTARSADATPPGGLLEAENVVIRKENTIEPRPGFQTSALPAATASGGALGRVEYPIGTNEAGVIHDGTTTLWDGFSGESDVITDENAAALSWRTYEGAVARRALYLCTSDIVRSLHVPGDDTAHRAGAPVPYISSVVGVTVTGDAPAVPSGDYRAYRAVTRRTFTDSSGALVIIRSAPSTRHVLHPLGSDQDIRVYVMIHEHEDWREGDVLELYASESGTTYPTDELYFAAEAPVPDPSGLAAGGFYVQITDRTSNDNLGDALYTNESREGSEASNVRPPSAGCMGVYRNSLWLGDLTYPAQLEISYKASFDETAAVSSEGIGRYTIGGTRTSGSATVTAVSAPDIALVKVGMFVFTGAWTVSGGEAPRVTAVGATSFTVNGTANSTVTGAIALEDGIRVGSYYAPARWFAHYARNGDVAASSGGYISGLSSTLYTAFTVTDEWSDISNQPAAEYRRRTFLAAMLANTTAPEVWATNGDRYTPALPEPSAADGYQMPQEVLPDHVAWSKQDEPDHFPLTQIDRVGRPGSTVMCLGESRNAILIATDQGLWLGSGYADSGISFDEVDKDVRALGKRCMAPAGTSQYVATDTGVFECDENQAVNITDLKINDLDALFFAVAATRVSSLKVVSNAKDNEILVCCPSATAITDEILSAYVFNTLTRAWTKWTLPTSLAPDGVWDVTAKGPRRRLTGCASGLELNLLEKISTSTDPLADNFAFSVTIDTAAGLGVTLTGAPAVALQVGDALIQSSVTYLITSVVSTTSFTVHAAGLVAGAATPRAGISCTITPSVNTVKTPQFMKVWGTGAIAWARRAGVYQFGLAFRSAITGLNTAVSQTKTLSPAPGSNTDARSAPASSPFLTPRGAARGTHLCLTITIRQACADWAIEQISVRVRTTADKLPPRLP